MIGWKKVRGAVLRLSILGEVVPNRVGEGYHTDLARVLEAYPSCGSPPTRSGMYASLHDPHFYYTPGSAVHVPISWDNESGIHFYTTRDEARRH